MQNIQDRIDELEAKLKQAKAKKQQLESKKRAIESKKKRSDDTRKKILAGTFVFSEIANGRLEEDYFIKVMDLTLVRDDDRALFGLPKRDSAP